MNKDDNCAHCGVEFGDSGFYELQTRSYAGMNRRRIVRRYCVKCTVFVMDIIRSFDCFLMKEIFEDYENAG